MSAGLPPMVAGDGISKRTAVHFGGYNHTLGAGDGEIYDMENMTSDNYPVLSTRKERLVRRYAAGTDGMCMVKGETAFVTGGTLHTYSEKGMTLAHITGLAPGGKTCIQFGAYTIVMPDKKYYLDAEEPKSGDIEAKFKDAEENPITIQDGTYKGETAKANTLYCKDARWSELFKVGDAVTFKGFSKEANNQTIIIREIEGDYLRFYENSFKMPDQNAEGERITVERTMPDMDYMCVNENRLWGCKGSTVYASKLGDPFNWNVFDGVSTDSFAADVGSGGDFTGCISYLGYPCFFKEDHIYKVYGDRPSNFQIMESASLGTARGSARSLAVAGETLFYLSRIGIVAYTGGIPQSIAAPFGNIKYKNAIAGSDGVKYYVSMQDEDDAWHFFAYDTQRNMWHREDDTHALSFLWDGKRLMWRTENGVMAYGEDDDAFYKETTKIESFVEFADFTDGDQNHKGTAKLQLRMELSENASVTVKMQFDSDGVWHNIKTLTTTKKKSFYLPIVPRRADHFRIRIEGKGEWRLYSMTRESYSGSEL